MAPPLARLPAAGRAAAADAQPQAPRGRGARPAGHRDQPRPAALDRLVLERHLAGDGLPIGDHRPRDRRAARRGHRRSRSGAAGRAITCATSARIELLDKRLEKFGTVSVLRDAGGVGRDLARVRRSTPSSSTNTAIGSRSSSAGFPALAHGGVRHPLSGRLRRRRVALARRPAEKLRQIDDELRKDTSPDRAPRT